MQKKMLDDSEHVGDRFPDEARAIHLGEAEARAIHGRASPADAESLRDEGIPDRAPAVPGAGARRGELTGDRPPDRQIRRKSFPASARFAAIMTSNRLAGRSVINMVIQLCIPAVLEEEQG